jgi:hypothetical protein
MRGGQRSYWHFSIGICSQLQRFPANSNSGGALRFGGIPVYKCACILRCVLVRVCVCVCVCVRDQ